MTLGLYPQVILKDKRSARETATPVLRHHRQRYAALSRLHDGAAARLDRQRDAIATVRNRELILSPIGKLHATSGGAFPAITLHRADVACGHRYSLADAGACRRVTVGGEAKAGKKNDPRKLRPMFQSKADEHLWLIAEASRTLDAQGPPTTLKFETR